MDISYTNLGSKNVADILIVTATSIETDALYRQMQPVCSDGLLNVEKGERRYTLGRLAEFNVIHCQCKNMGTQEVGSSTLTTTNALMDWPCVKAVIMVGIAFGMYNEETDQSKQNLGDVLVATKIFPYENQRWNKDGSIRFRGKEHKANSHLIDAFRLIQPEWNHTNIEGIPTKVEYCPLLTGEKLVDDLDKRNQLKELYRDYRGGEMEGMGIASACEDKQKPWIIVKAICDFADGNKGDTPEEEELKIKKQISAAEASVAATRLALAKANICQVITNKTNYYYRLSDVDLEKTFFMAYDKSCSEYYFVRRVDDELVKHILTKHIWVYGETGIGKSELLRRALVENDVEFVYIDLSLCNHSDVDAMFQTMYETIAEYMGIEAINCTNYQTSVKNICNIINSCQEKQEICLFVEEIPFEEENLEFQDFVNKVAKMLVFMTGRLNNKKVHMVLSTIAKPKGTLEVYEDKTKNAIHFVEMGKWNMDECMSLVSLLTKTVSLHWESVELMQEFIKRTDFSPRRIKSRLKECCSLEINTINENIINKLFSE